MRRAAQALPAAAAALGLLALAGCGSAASDSAALAGEARPPAYPGAIMLASEPPGAACVLTNAANQARIGTVTTPATVPLARSNDIIAARCSAPGRMETTAMIRPVRDFAEGIHHPQPTGPAAMAQIATVLRTGSTRRYTDTTVHLPPDPFASAAARDAWFADRAAQMRAAAAPAVARAERAAQATIDTPETLRRHLAEDLARLDAQKAAATIEAPAAARRR